MLKQLKHLSCYLSLLIFAFSLVACGGGGGGGSNTTPVPNVNADGFWNGTFTEGGVTYDLNGVVYNNKFIGVSIDAGVLYTGNIGISGDQLTGSVDVIVIGGGFDHTTNINATVVEGVSMTGTASDPTSTSTFALSFDINSLWNRTPNLNVVAGTYSLTSGTYTYTQTVTSNGSYIGFDTDGCNYSGTYSPFDSTHNYYRMTMTVSNCGTFNGTYVGSAYMADFNVTNDNLVMIIDDPAFLLIYGTLRQ